jgi:hypothetical protein
MSYRMVKFPWLPSTPEGWLIFTSVRKEASRLWSWLVERHAEIRQQGGRWPTRNELQEEIKGLFPGLHSQSAQISDPIAKARGLNAPGRGFGGLGSPGPG